MKKPDNKGHSEEYFGDFRDHWYNQDFLELMAKRWELKNVNSLLDVGCGQCHWTRIASSFLNKGSHVTAVDSDPKWAKSDEKLEKFFSERDIAFQIEEADALNLPYKDNSFDAVTSQTVLIHIENPLNALREMKRVLKPGGILFCAEPNNLVASVVKDSITAEFRIEEVIEWFTFGLIKEKGKIKQGKGDNSVGDLLPKFFSQLQLKDIRAHLSDKANVIIPPYNSEESKSMLDFRLENYYEDFMKAETKKQFEQFGGKYDAVLKRAEKKMDEYKAELKDATRNQTYYDVSTAVMYLVSGRK
ncbi:MAG: class I SAM-dependent methyltransferase [Pyrinomonadaceae bacterium]|nr:class I SAM-dependent methyltransferase [Pyrinomonadaceae bacterium]